MGTDGNAVVDRDGRHRRYDNLFVSGGAVFPSMSPAHPTLTIAALALRLGASLAGGA
jgi:choline dehydrogenase-like flavoprotein